MDFALEASIEEFRYWRATQPALRAVELKVRRGEFVAITGPAGAGKTTLCYCLSGAIPHFTSGIYRGAVKVNSRDLATLRLPQIAALLGIVLQRPENQLFNLTVEEDVAFGPENLCEDPSDIRHRVSRSLAFAGMQDFAKRACDRLSGGETQRIVLSAILALDPDLFILDQPAAELDPKGRRQVYENVHRLNKEAGKTIVLVEDRLDAVLPFVSRLLLMDGGRIVKDAPPGEFFADERVLSSGIRLPGSVQRHSVLDDGARERERACSALRTEAARPRSSENDSTRQRTGDRGQLCALAVRDLSFRYPKCERWALRGINLAFKRGEFTAIIGENGAGKTTLAKHLIGLLRPTRGTVVVNGRDVSRLSVSRISDVVGYLFQDPDYQLFGNSVFDEVAFSLKIKRVAPDEIEERVSDVLQRLGLLILREQHPYALSRGQRQRLALAAVLARRPDVLVVDEPSTGLDYRDTVAIMDLLAEFCAVGGTVLVISHDIEMVVRYAERSIVMAGGDVLLDTATAALVKHPDVLAQAAVELPDLSGLLTVPSGREGEEVVRLIVEHGAAHHH